MSPSYCLIGEHLSHSFSPAIHNSFGDFGYETHPMPPHALAEFFAKREFCGVNVTIPYKKAVIPFCDALTPTAQRIGSVNTILHRPDGTLLGHNTDYDGFLYMLRGANAQVAGKKCLILGNGGVSPTVRVALEDLNAGEIITISRSGVDNYENISRHYDAQIIVNTTPVGMYPNCGVSPIDLTQFPLCQGVYELIYNPARTQLMLDAQRLSIPAVGGLPMLVAQAKVADELYLNAPIDDSRVDALVAKMEADTKNILLIGMPGCGKSTVGFHLSRRLGRKFVDTDALIEAKIGSIPHYFAQHGEEAFRQVEHQVLLEVSRESGLVIATGGGIVTRPENHDPLRQNSTVVFLQRALSQLPTSGRPISQSTSVEALYNQRLPLYRQLCDLEVRNQREIPQIVSHIMEELSL